MTAIAITGARGFLGRNLAAHLRERKQDELFLLDRASTPQQWTDTLDRAEIVFHLAGINRPRDVAEFETGNAAVTAQLCNRLRSLGRAPKIVFSSSIQAESDNPYGVSKARAEAELHRFAADTGAAVAIYRLNNLYGKWCRPNYNAVTATFCHNIACGLPIAISDPAREIELSYVDDVVKAFLAELSVLHGAVLSEIPSRRISLGDLAARIQAFHDLSTGLVLPDMSDDFNRALYATYLSYVPAEERMQARQSKSDPRGSLAELLKQPSFGQIFVSRTLPGITRGNHYHHTKTEMFVVLQGDGLIRMRPIEGGPVQEYRVAGDAYQVVHIPPGYTHSITNVGQGEMVTLFWASEIFDPSCPDTCFLPVDAEPSIESRSALDLEPKVGTA
jgi:UDP-2-acetamido-2,6-beta-L-arabino-hexul-4-ose reductase